MNMLKKCRKDKGFTIEQASVLSGIPKSLLSQIESGIRTIPVEKAHILAKLYKVPLENIFEPVRFTPRMVQVKDVSEHA